MVKLWNDRREYATSADTRGSSSCCTPMLHCQSWSRTPHPLSVSWFTCVMLPESPPKFRLLPVSAAHSPLSVRMARLHSTIRSPSSVQPRVVVQGRPPAARERVGDRHAVHVE